MVTVMSVSGTPFADLRRACAGKCHIELVCVSSSSGHLDLRLCHVLVPRRRFVRAAGEPCRIDAVLNAALRYFTVIDAIFAAAILVYTLVMHDRLLEILPFIRRRAGASGPA